MTTARHAPALPARPARPARRSRSLVIATIVAAIAVVATMLSIKQSGAFWRGTSSAASGTLTAGTLILTSNGTHTLTLPALGGTALNLGAMKTASVTVRNAGTTTLGWKLTSVTSSDAAKLQLTASVVTSASDCDGSTSSTMPGTTITPASGYRTLLKGASEILCLRGTVTSAAVSGATYTGSFDVGAMQQ